MKNNLTLIQRVEKSWIKILWILKKVSKLVFFPISTRPQLSRVLQPLNWQQPHRFVSETNLMKTNRCNFAWDCDLCGRKCEKNWVFVANKMRMRNYFEIKMSRCSHKIPWRQRNEISTNRSRWGQKGSLTSSKIERRRRDGRRKWRKKILSFHFRFHNIFFTDREIHSTGKTCEKCQQKWTNSKIIKLIAFPESKKIYKNLCVFSEVAIKIIS